MQRERIDCLRSNERASVVVGEATDDNQDDIDDVPDTESTGYLFFLNEKRSEDVPFYPCTLGIN